MWQYTVATCSDVMQGSLGGKEPRKGVVKRELHRAVTPGKILLAMRSYLHHQDCRGCRRAGGMCVRTVLVAHIHGSL